MKRVSVILIVVAFAAVITFGRTELSFWYAWGGDEGKALLNLVDEFNKSQDRIIVRPVFVPIGQGEKINTALAGSSTPDIVTIWDWMVVPLGENGALISLNDYLDSAGVTEEDFLPGAWTYGSYRGVKYGLPTTLNAYAFMWNKSLFKEVGLDPDRPPESIEELDRYAELLFRQDTRGNIRRIGFLPNISHIYFYVFGGQLWDQETEEITANHPGNIKALDWVASYYKKFDLQKIRVFQATWGEMASSYNPFYRGQLAIQEAGQWELLFIKQFAKPDFEYGVSPFPAPEGGREKVAYLNGSFWAIPKGSKYPDEAFEFLNWLTASHQSARFAAQLSNIPPKVEAINDPVFADNMPQNMEVYIDMLTNGYVYSFPTLPIGLFYMEELNQALQYVQSGAKTAERALNDVQEAVLRELKRYE
jgi:multiple sugar transport system substrate-binding protein